MGEYRAVPEAKMAELDQFQSNKGALILDDRQIMLMIFSVDRHLAVRSP
jgi:hypothetical protein